MEANVKTLGIAAVAVVVGGLIIKKKIDDAGGLGALTQDAAASAMGGVIRIADGATSGVVLGIGDAVGVPRTNMNACELAIAEGRTWDASFACPAGRFIEYLGSGK
jgi:hypothetical protein